MKNLSILLIPFLLSGCLFEEKQAPPEKQQAASCYEIIPVPNGSTPNSPILLDKCSGDTWLLLRNSESKQANQLTPDFTWGWYKIEKSAIYNSVAGIPKQ